MPTPVLAPSTDPVVNELVKLNQQLLDAIAAGDWDAYRSLVAEDITCFEPESEGHLVQGLAFHEFYFKLGGGKAQPPKHLTTTMVAPRVRLLADGAALLASVRLVQKLDADGKPITVSSEETRLWQKISGRWQHVHFHRS
jgi:calcium/calmodulin-dependent protein kinase (CaM kinase) II